MTLSPDQTVDCNAIPAPATVTATDNCDTDVPVSYTETSNTVVDGCGQIVREWTATDACGNNVTETQTITVTDTEAPVLIGVPADQTVDCNAIPAPATVTATDNCDTDVPVSYTETSNTVVDGCGQIVREWTATDACVNEVTGAQTILVVFPTRRSSDLVPGNQTVDCNAIPAPPTVTATDNCDTAVPVSYSQISNTVVDGCGVIVREWTATDACGNVVTGTQTITVVDTTPPVLAGVPGNQTVDCNAIPAPATVTATDNCDTDVPVSYTETSNTVVDGCGVIVREWTATDACGNVVTETQTITVTDTEAPVLVGVPADQTVDCNAIPVPVTVTATDNCDTDVPVNYSETSNTVVDGCGVIVREWTATDACGNVVTETQTITVTDTEAPVLIGVPADQTVDCNTIPAPATVTATDNCDTDVPVSYTETSNTVVDGCGQIVREWTATDACGNIVTETQTITVTDTEAPVLIGVPADQTVDCNAIPAPATVTATDNCDTDVPVSYTETSNTVVDGCGQIVREWTATDACGNVITETQTITVTDTEPPALVGVPADQTVDCNAIPAPATVTATDNCDTDVPVSYTETSNTVVDGCGVIVREWTATDVCGNIVTETQTITVTDTEDPVLVGVPADQTVDCNAIPAPATVTATDNCDTDVPVSYTENSNTVVDGCGVIVREWTATDDCGNVVTETQTITVTDTEPPVLVGVPADQTVDCNAIPAPATVTATDNCDTDVPVSYTETSNTVVDGCGVIVREWTATDACGNVVTEVQTITVTDTEAPVLIGVPADQTVDCNAIPAPATVTATDNCDTDVPVSYTETSNTVVDGCGQIVREWTATDACGNVITETQTITVTDTEAPVLIGVPADQTVDCNTIPAPATVTATDNCDTDVPVSYTETSNTVVDGCGVIVREWTATDACGNIVTETQTITVTDTEPPVLVGVPADQT